MLKVLRKAVLFHQNNDSKRARIYLGLTKREWGFIRRKGFLLPSDVCEKVEKWLQEIYHPGADISGLENKIKQSIIESLKEKAPPSSFSEFKKRLAEQDEVLRDKITQ